jgi:hypothetical protein
VAHAQSIWSERGGTARGGNSGSLLHQIFQATLDCEAG